MSPATGALDTFVTRFNQERPHQALGMKVPADLYARSPRVYHGLNELTCPFHDQTIMVTGCSRIWFRGRKVNLSHLLCRAERRRHAGRRASGS